MREYNASKIVENTTETSLPASYDHQEYMISESNCLSNDAGSIGIMKGYTMMLNFSYEVDVAVIPHAGLFFATEKLPFVERSIVDYLGKQLFYDNCKDSRLDAIVGISSFPKDIFSLDMKCNEKQHLHGQQQENGSTKDNETASICYVIDGTMTLISVNSTAMDDDVRRIRGMILGIVDRTFGNVEIGLNRISVLVVDDESIPTTPTSGNIASPSDSSETSSMGRVSNKSDSPARMRIIIAISVMAACSLVLMAALLKTQLTQRREKHAWDEIRKILTESNSSTDGSRS